MKRISSAVELRGFALRLVWWTRSIRDRELLPALAAGPCSGNSVGLVELYHSMQAHLPPGLDEREFADLYAQTLTIGLFTVAAHRHSRLNNLNRDTAPHHLRNAREPFRSLLSFIASPDVPPSLALRLDRLIDLLNRVNTHQLLIQPPCANITILTGGSGAVLLYFYQIFLSQYPALGVRARVANIPPAVIVDFIVTSIHAILRQRLKRYDGLSAAGVRILDPVAGPSVFLARVLEFALNHSANTYGEGMRFTLAPEYIAHHLYGTEPQLIPYLVSHLHLGHILRSMGLRLPKTHSFNLHLGHILELDSSRAPFEMQSFTVILGAPPPGGPTPHAPQLIAPYTEVSGQQLDTKSLSALQADYVKLIRLAQVKIEENGDGVASYITNHAYLDNAAFRGMRQSLLGTFTEIYILHLTVQKQAICFLIRSNHHPPRACKVFYARISGGEGNHQQLNGQTIFSQEWQRLHPEGGMYLFAPPSPQQHQHQSRALYQRFFSLAEIFPLQATGIVTGRDHLTIQQSEAEILGRVQEFAGCSEEEARYRFELGDDSRDWQVEWAQADVRACGLDPGRVTPILYRPFERHWTFYTGKSRGFHCMPRWEVMKHMLQPNLALITARQLSREGGNNCLATTTIVDGRAIGINRGMAHVFPLYLYPFPQGKPSTETGVRSLTTLDPGWKSQPNIDPRVFLFLRREAGFPAQPTPEQLFYYIYALLFCPAYQETWASGLASDFPRVVFPADLELFNEMARWGERLAAVHLLQSPALNHSAAKFEIDGDNIITKIRHHPLGLSQQGRVYINEHQFFSHVSPRVWNYQLCGYPVLKKWFRSLGQKRELECKEMAHAITIIQALELTLEYQEEINRLYPQVERLMIMSS